MSTRVTLLTRVGCHLCESALATVTEVLATSDAELRVIDVDSEADLAVKYTDHVPVLLVDEVLVAYWFVTAETLKKALADGPESISVPPL